LILILILCAGGNFELVNEQEKTFCVPKPTASEQEMIANIEYACAHLGDFCSRIKPNGSCFYPDETVNHASVAMNMYYVLNRRTNSSCNFSNSGIISLTDPSKHLFGGINIFLLCKYVFSMYIEFFLLIYKLFLCLMGL
jgi:hypothetical protein